VAPRKALRPAPELSGSEPRKVDQLGGVIGSQATPSTAAAQPFYVAGARVVTKCRADATIDNDGTVDTKSGPCAAFGNDAIGFIRVRKRQLKGGHRDWRDYRARNGMLATTSASFDLVRAVRVNGKPRHEFILGFGSQKDIERNSFAWFWVRAIWRMTKHGLAEPQRRRLIEEMLRKGARLPNLEQCEQHTANWPRNSMEIGELVRWLQSSTQRRAP
jgi:hypothetical protein